MTSTPLSEMERPLIPQPSHYAVICLDPEGMVKDLGLEDVETLREVQNMSRKKYLVFLQWPEELPMPDMRWCRYEVLPIGTTLRPPDEAQGITSDMVIPIAPNKHYTGGRRPLYPTPSFPFSNCYHWIMNGVTVRVRVHEEGVAHDGAIRLPPAERYAMNQGFFPDCERIGTFLHEKYGPTSPSAKADNPHAAAATTSAFSTSGDDSQKPLFPVGAVAKDGTRIDVLTDTYLRLVTQRGLRSSVPTTECEALERSGLHSSEDVSGSQEAQKQSTVTPVTSRDSEVDVFGWDPDPNTAQIPLVDVWLDIDKQLTEDTIPNPLELQKEMEEVTAIITRGLARFASAQKTAQQIQEEHTVSDSELPAEPGELEETDCCVQTLRGLWQDLGAQYINSSASSEPPFPLLIFSDSANLDEADSLPGHAVVDASTSCPPASHRSDDASPPPDAVGPDTPPPTADTNSDRAPSPALAPHLTPARTPKTRFTKAVRRAAANASILPSARKHPGASGAIAPQSSGPSRGIANDAHPQALPRPRRSRASTMYHRLRTKFVNFFQPG